MLSFQYLKFLNQNNETIKTVCPIELTCIHLSKAKDKDYIIFDDEKDIKYFDFEEAKKKLNSLLCNKKGKYSDTAIKLNLYSYYCADIKFVDLPGITKIGKFKIKYNKLI